MGFRQGQQLRLSSYNVFVGVAAYQSRRLPIDNLANMAQWV